MTLPLNWRWPEKVRFLEDPITYLAEVYNSLAEEISRPSWLQTGAVAVGAGLTTIAVVVDIDRLPYFVSVSTSWLTTTQVTLKTLTGFTVNFGTAAPGGGGTMDYTIINPEAGPG